ncbi:MAG: LamG domain-containing protein [Planctomycetota bacterium]
MLAAALLSLAPVVGPDVDVTIDPPLLSVGQESTITVTGPAGDWVVFMVSNARGQSFVPLVGEIGLSMTDGFAFAEVGMLDSQGLFEVPLTIDCDSHILESLFFLQVLTIGMDLQTFCTSDVIALEAVADDCDLCAGNPDPSVALGAEARDWGFELETNGIPTDFRFVKGGEFIERPDGTAVVRGIVASTTDADCRGYVDLFFDGRVGAVEDAPAGSPVLGLDASAYLAGGGSINPDSWHYYEIVTGSLQGLSGCLEGALLDLNVGGTAAQFGFGANNASEVFGADAELIFSVVDQPDQGQIDTNGLASLRVDTRGCDEDGERSCPVDAQGGSEFCTGGLHTLWLGAGLGDFQLVDPVGAFTEFADGTATIRGEVFREKDPSQRLCIDVLLSGRLDPGDAAHPPVGSPKFALCDDFLAPEGPIDPLTFVYFTEMNGVLLGKGDYEGAVLKIERKGPAAQLGVGANDKNLNFGLSGWFYVDVCQQPTTGVHIPAENGDFNFDLITCPELVPTDSPLVHYTFDEDPDSVVVDTMSMIDLLVVDAQGSLSKVDGGIRMRQGSDFETSLVEASSSESASLLANLKAAGEFTAQAYVTIDEEAQSDARLVTFSSSTSVSQRNFSLMGYPKGNDVEIEARIRTSTGSHRFEYDLEQLEVDELAVVAMTFEDGLLRTYLDGQVIGSEDVGGTLSVWSTHTFRIGNEQGGDRGFEGDLFDVKVWGRALSQNELVQQSNELLTD